MRKEIFPENGSQKVHQFPSAPSCRQGAEKAGKLIPALNCATGAGLSKKESPHCPTMAYPGGFEPLTPRVGVWYSIQLSYGYPSMNPNCSVSCRSNYSIQIFSAATTEKSKIEIYSARNQKIIEPCFPRIANLPCRQGYTGGRHIRLSLFPLHALRFQICSVVFAVSIPAAFSSPSLCVASSRILYLRIFPAAFIGNACTKSIYFGTLCLAREALI